MRHMFLGRYLQMAICLLLVVSLIAALSLPSFAARASKVTTQRAIAIVFDNSGSMYLGDDSQKKAWCRATYAIEVFAAMMNEGDVLEIYPMHPVEVNGQQYTDSAPLVIDSADEVSLIRNMYTPVADATPIETVTAAYEGLRKRIGKEQWLIVLTDGDVFYENDEIIGGAGQSKQAQSDATKVAISQLLSEYNQHVNVMYLGIGKVAVEAEITGGRYQCLSAKAADTGNVLSELTAMCNMIFGRDVLATSGSKVSFDLPMSKLIIFVQGSDVSNVSLVDASGQSIGTVIGQYSPHYGERGAGNYATSFRVDNNLQGVILTYGDCPAGDYVLHYSGNVTSTGIYYEPDVDLAVNLLDEAGNLVEDATYPGTYYVSYGMVDNEGNVTESALLGETNFCITYTHNGVDYPVNSKKPGKIEIQVAAEDTLDVDGTATYLSGYHIQKSGADLGWPSGGFRIAPRPAGNLKLQVSGGRDTYLLSELEEEGVYTIKLLYEGAPVTGEALERTELQVECTNGEGEGEPVLYELEKSSDGYLLNLRYNGSAANTRCTDYQLLFSATYTNEDAQVAQSNQVVAPYAVEDNRHGLEVKLVFPQSYYQRSKITKAEPMTVLLTKNGEILTAEELNAVDLRVEGEGLNLLVTPLPEQSAYEVRFDPEGNYESGFYTISCAASATDPIGTPLQAEDSGRIEIQAYPQWLRWLVIFLIIASIIALILAYLNTKILPKQIAVRSGSTIFNVDGSRVNGNAKYEYSGKNKKSGGFSMSVPKCSTAPLAKGGFDLELVAVSPRKVKSAQRRAGVVSLTPVNGSAVHTVQVGNTTYKKDSEGRFSKVGGKKVANAKDKKSAVLFEVANNANCVVSGTTVDGTSFSCTCRLQFN